ncbi:amidohydrolase family protein [Streptomyces sp. NPDC058457]|uniref:amidohydrolase family protein n=1 Tax=Streptomyces sp. NPDC058457 TaxID=3346507 RepID=UPI00364E7D65
MVDVHAHFWPPEPEASRIQLWEQLRDEGCFLAPRPWGWSPEETLDVMDRAGVAMQLLSNIPKEFGALQASNDYGASVVADHPTRFGLLAALPTDDAEAALTELDRADRELGADGFAVTAAYNGVFLGDRRLEPVWAELDRRHATVFVHPNASAAPSLGRPAALMEVAFETARSVADLLYAGVFRRHTNLRIILAHAGGALPALSGRLTLLGAEPWVPNPENLSVDEIREQLRGLYVDSAASGTLRPPAPTPPWPPPPR